MSTSHYQLTIFSSSPAPTGSSGESVVARRTALREGPHKVESSSSSSAILKSPSASSSIETGHSSSESSLMDVPAHVPDAYIAKFLSKIRANPSLLRDKNFPRTPREERHGEALSNKEVEIDDRINIYKDFVEVRVKDKFYSKPRFQFVVTIPKPIFLSFEEYSAGVSILKEAKLDGGWRNLDMIKREPQFAKDIALVLVQFKEADLLSVENRETLFDHAQFAKDIHETCRPMTQRKLNHFITMKKMMALLMGTHPRVGAKSPGLKLFAPNPANLREHRDVIADPKIFYEIYTCLNSIK